MATVEHTFTATIRETLAAELGELSDEVLERSELVQYLNIKTRSANRGSKSRGSFANLYAIYVLVEDYLAGGFDRSGRYANYDGARFTDLFRRQRELPFGERLQNHALNSRLNEEYRKYFPTSQLVPIRRDLETSRYWINERLLLVKTSSGDRNIARSVISIIDTYIAAKRDSFDAFLEQCTQLETLDYARSDEVMAFVLDLLRPNADARIFEVASFAIMKASYQEQSIWIGPTREGVSEEALLLFKTGRTNANDGGIDFVMRPVGRFFQVTETLDMRKYFLDIDKVQRFPITFVIKSEESVERLRAMIEEHAWSLFPAERVVRRYMEAVEEIVNIPDLREMLHHSAEAGRLGDVIREIALQARVEFNLDPIDT